MKRCSKYRERIVWLTANALDPAEERDLQTHLESCPACRAYGKEMAALTGKLASAPQPAKLVASKRFHQQVVRAIRNESQGRTNGLLTRWYSLAWRVGLPLVGAAAVMIAVLSPGLERKPTLRKSPTPLPPSAIVQIELQPTVFNYQMVANASLDLDGLDDLLTRQGNRNPPPTPRFSEPLVAGATTME